MGRMVGEVDRQGTLLLLRACKLHQAGSVVGTFG